MCEILTLYTEAWPEFFCKIYSSHKSDLSYGGSTTGLGYIIIPFQV